MLLLLCLIEPQTDLQLNGTTFANGFGHTCWLIEHVCEEEIWR